LLKHVLIEVWKSITQSIIFNFEFNIKLFKTYQKHQSKKHWKVKTKKNARKIDFSGVFKIF
jgi:hypothetical protein